MPFFEYMLLALLGSAGAATPGETPRDPSTRTFTADAVTQPAGGAKGEGYFNAEIGLLGQGTTGSTGTKSHPGKGVKRHVATRRHHRTGHRRKVTDTGRKATKKVP